MKSRIILLSIILTVIVGAGFLFTQNGSKPKSATKSSSKTQEQFIVLLDLSDRIIQPGQIDADKSLIKATYEEFERKAYSKLVINSKDKFHVFIAPQKNLPFDKDIETEKLSIDLSTIKVGERAKRLKAYKGNLNAVLDSLYVKAYIGSDAKLYQGSNIWQFFNETLPALTNTGTNTRLVVLSDGYFDFEENNAKLTKGNLSTTTAFLSKLRKSQEWKSEMQKSGYGILPVNQKLEHTSICVSEIRSKFPNNLNENEMLVYVWADWLQKIGFNDSCSATILHGNISTTQTQLSTFFKRPL